MAPRRPMSPWISSGCRRERAPLSRCCCSPVPLPPRTGENNGGMSPSLPRNFSISGCAIAGDASFWHCARKSHLLVLHGIGEKRHHPFADPLCTLSLLLCASKSRGQTVLYAPPACFCKTLPPVSATSEKKLLMSCQQGKYSAWQAKKSNQKSPPSLSASGLRCPTPLHKTLIFRNFRNLGTDVVFLRRFAGRPNLRESGKTG